MVHKWERKSENSYHVDHLCTLNTKGGKCQIEGHFYFEKLKISTFSMIITTRKALYIAAMICQFLIDSVLKLFNKKKQFVDS